MVTSHLVFTLCYRFMLFCLILMSHHEATFLLIEFFSTWTFLVEYFSDRPEVCGDAEDDNQHGIVDVKSVGDKGEDTHRPHDL